MIHPGESYTTCVKFSWTLHEAHGLSTRVLLKRLSRNSLMLLVGASLLENSDYSHGVLSVLFWIHVICKIVLPKVLFFQVTSHCLFGLVVNADFSGQ